MKAEYLSECLSEYLGTLAQAENLSEILVTAEWPGRTVCQGKYAHASPRGHAVSIHEWQKQDVLFAAGNWDWSPLVDAWDECVKVAGRGNDLSQGITAKGNNDDQPGESAKPLV